MGLFSSSSTSSLPPPKLSSDGTPIAPDRTQRARCWEARDAYFACLEQHAIVDSISEEARAKTLCGREGEAFDGNCASSWVTYFKKRRVMEHQRAKMLEKLQAEGAQKMPGEIGPPGPNAGLGGKS